MCWKYENLGIRMGDKFAARGFDANAEAAKALLNAGRQLFPKVKTEFE